jgi:hypothetical protein
LRLIPARNQYDRQFQEQGDTDHIIRGGDGNMVNGSAVSPWLANLDEIPVIGPAVNAKIFRPI